MKVDMIRNIFVSENESVYRWTQSMSKQGWKNREMGWGFVWDRKRAREREIGRERA